MPIASSAKVDIQDVRAMMRKIEAQFDETAAQLEAAARAMKDQRRLPDPTLENLIETTRTRFTALRAAHEAFGQWQGEGTPSLSDLESLLSAHESLQVAEKTRDALVSALSKLKTLSSHATKDAASIERLLAWIDEIEVRWQEEPIESIPELSDYTKKTGLLFYLISMIERGSDLEDEDWEHGDRQIRAFDAALSTGLIRGRLYFDTEKASSPKPEEALSPPKTEPAASAKGLVSAVATDVSALPEDSASASGVATAVKEPHLIPLKEPPLGSSEETAASPADSAPLVLPSKQTDTDDRPIDAASEVLRPDLDPEHALVTTQIWKLLGADRLGLGIHLSQALEHHGGGLPACPGSEWFYALLLAPYVAQGHVELNAEYGRCIESIESDFARLDASDSAFQWAGQLLLLAVAMRPSLLVPSTRAPSLLQKFSMPKTSALMQLKEDLLAFTRLGFQMTPNLIRGQQERTAWSREFDELRAEVKEWWGRNQSVRFSYEATTKIWHRWLNEKGLLGSGLRAIVADDRAQLGLVRGLSKKITGGRWVQDQANRADQDIRGRWAKLRKLEASAYRTLNRHVDEVQGFFVRWQSFVDDEPTEAREYQFKSASQCRKRLIEHLPAAQEEIQHVIEEQAGHPVGQAAGALKRQVSALERLFDDRGQEAPKMDLNWLRYGELLGLDLELELVRTVPVADVDSAAVPELLKAAKSSRPTPEVIFEHCCARGAHDRTQWILELAEQGVLADLKPEKLREQRQVLIEKDRAQLEQDVHKGRRQVEDGAANGLLEESTRSEFMSFLESVDPQKALNFSRVGRVLDRIGQRIEEKRAEAMQRVRKQIEAAHEVPARRRQRIIDELENGLIEAAREMLELAKRNEPEETIGDKIELFEGFFPKFVRDFTERYQAQRRNLLAIFEQLKPQGAVDSDVADAVEDWRRAGLKPPGREAVKPLKEVLSALMTFIGLDAVKVTATKPTDVDWARGFEVTGIEIADRDRCAVPLFGSKAKGNYRLLCIWNQTSEEGLLRLLKRQPNDLATIVFCFGLFDESKRRRFSRGLRSQRQLVLFIDDAGLIQLCLSARDRFDMAIRTSLPLGSSNPYTTTPGVVPPEMFYGRRSELDDVCDPMGTCLVYGGRQLGKTALLRYVMARKHAPEQGLVVVYIDLNHEGIGASSPPSDIWRLIARELFEAKVLKKSTQSFESVRKGVLSWLSGGPRRRILVLLDESDQFFELDQQGASEDTKKTQASVYPNLQQIKGLMDKTDRQFKVVFAGLHNVQRMAKDPNTPLAHLGRPLCIGPLLENDEHRQAFELIVRPMATLGYRFESRALVYTILGHTNYYPSLIQIFCQHLVKYLRAKEFQWERCPPYPITRADIDNVLRIDDIRKDIVVRFYYTLDLDTRYRFLALVIAYGYVGDATSQAFEGLQLENIRNECMELWPQGFSKGSSLEDFNTLLDEMTGLGILRSQNGRFVLRNANVVKLLGTKEEIEDKLTDAAQQEPPPEYEPSTFRRAIKSANTRSPLTAQQESVVLAKDHGVSVIFGSRAAGIDKVAEALQTAPVENVTILPSIPGSNADFKAAFANHKEGVNVAILGPAPAWDLQALEYARGFVANKSSGKFKYRIVFLGDEQQAWAWCQVLSGTRERLRNQGRFGIHTLGPWSETALRRWGSEIGFGEMDSSGGRHVFFERTGNWGELIHEAARSVSFQQARWEKGLSLIEERVSSRSGIETWFWFPNEALSTLKVMADLEDEPVSCAELQDLIEEEEIAQHVPAVLEWIELVGHGRRIKGSQYQLGRFARRLLERIVDQDSA